MTGLIIQMFIEGPIYNTILSPKLSFIGVISQRIIDD